MQTATPATTIPVATSASDLATRIKAFRAASTFHAEPIALTQIDADKLEQDTTKTNRALWRMDRGDGYFGRLDHSFFAFGGIRAFPKGPGQFSYDQGAVFESSEKGLPAGTIVLIYERGTGAVLAEMRADAGSDASKDFVTFGPTLQASASRVQKAREQGNDHALPLLGALVGLGAFVPTGTFVQQDPGRFFRKTNEVRAFGVESKAAFEEALNRAFDEAQAAGKPVPRSKGLVWANLKDLYADENRQELNEFFWQALGVLGAEQAKTA